jgi:hypothetical protein
MAQKIFVDQFITLKAAAVADNITGMIVTIETKPEIIQAQSKTDVRQVPEGQTSDYISVQFAGSTTIKMVADIVQAGINLNDKLSPILLNTTGVTLYDIEGDSYMIRSVEITDTNALITLESSFKGFIDPVAPVEPSKIINFEISTPTLTYQITDFVKGSNLTITDTDTSNPRLRFEIYKYSDDDVFLNNVIFNPFLFSFIVEQNYWKKGNTETETWSENEDDKQLSIAKNIFNTNDLGVTGDVVVYEIYSPFGTPFFRTLTG